MSEDPNLDFVPTPVLVAALKRRAPTSVIILAARQDEQSGPKGARNEFTFNGPPVAAWHLCRMMMAGLEGSYIDFVPPDFRPQQPPAQET